MKQCLQVGIPLEQRPVYPWNYDFWCSKSTTDCRTLSSNENTLSLGLNDYPVEKEDFPIIWYFQVIDRYGWDSGTAKTRLDISDLNEILLKNRVSNITTLLFWAIGEAPSHSNNRLQSPVPFKALGIVCWHLYLFLLAIIKQIQWIVWDPMSWKRHSLVD